MLMQERLTDAGAIASASAAGIYGATILRKSIEDDRRISRGFSSWRNRTRRLRCPGAAREKRAGHEVQDFDRVHAAQRAGSLFRALSAFALRDINLTKIESRPLRGKPWEYLFYLDFAGHTGDAPCRNALIIWGNSRFSARARLLSGSRLKGFRTVTVSERHSKPSQLTDTGNVCHRRDETPPLNCRDRGI